MFLVWRYFKSICAKGPVLPRADVHHAIKISVELSFNKDRARMNWVTIGR
jgi:hypothetical protein